MRRQLSDRPAGHPRGAPDEHDQSNLSAAKRVVLDFFDVAFVRREPARAAERYLGPGYTQHDPTAPDGAAVFPGLIGGLFAQAPEASFHLERAIAEDDLVVLHCNLKFSADDPGQAVIDIFRVQDGQIVEHWDVMQPVPAEAANGTACSDRLRRRVPRHTTCGNACLGK